MSFEGKNWQELENRLKIFDSEKKNWTPRVGAVCMYISIIFKLILKLSGHSKPNFIGNVYTKG